MVKGVQKIKVTADVSDSINPREFRDVLRERQGRLSLVGHSIRTLEDLEPLRLLFCTRFEIANDRWAVCESCREVFGYRKIVTRRVRRAVGVFRWRESWERRDEYAGKVGREGETRSFGIRGGKEVE